ncbi:long-chain fatty acid--CoA ligase [Oceanidesulfovibrio indonesiensis]|uniref:Long-chain fatty acid--CoA ligase n=1 Tax=Oceanidesulfovibrio indonesiensis TaxID=54767 RepID=A0A7M3MC99_9BACT|nr:long-chain fatty acid--CoA ligase [Oceanidesulfovibrio indonesiensis]TVM15982.1 long-chain fatty acid--CoA ligase [Oceanidesulfovibrio indonesiensis]
MDNTNEHIRPWFDSYDPEVPTRLGFRPTPLYAYLDDAARKNPRHTALLFQNYRLSYGALLEKAERVAAGLVDAGLAPGDRVAVMLPNLPQTIIAFWGVLKAGGVLVMINPLAMEKELTHQIGYSGARFLITLQRLWERVAPLAEQLSLERTYLTTIADGLAFPKNWLYTLSRRREGFKPPAYDGSTLLPWKALVNTRRREAGRVGDPEESLACIQYTGGTTGLPKGAMLTHANLSYNVSQCVAVIHGLEPSNETFLGLLPYFHVYGLTVCIALPTAVSASMLPFPRFAPIDVLEAIRKHSPTVFPGAPAVYIALMRQKNLSEYDLSSLKYCISGSAPMPVEALKRFQDLTGAGILEGFGLTETSPVTHLNPLQGTRKIGSIGLPLPDTDCRIVHMETGEDLPPGEPGELLIKGPQVMRGYWNKPEETAEVLRDGWFATGDIATMDPDGYFRIVDRKKDMIITAGYNVYPREVEETLMEHPAVKEAAVVGRNHPTRGESVVAYVVPEGGADITASELIGWCRGKIAPYKVPREVVMREDLPKSVIGKLLRKELRTGS